MSDKRQNDLSRRSFMGSAVAAGAYGLLADGAEPEEQPNILLLFSDQHHAGVMGCAGHPDVITPNLDRMATEGVRFDRTYCQDGVCVPSRTSMMTGQYPRSTGVLYNPDRPTKPESMVPLQQKLRDSGYYTGAFGKRHLGKGLDHGWDASATTLPKRHEPSDDYYWDWIGEQGALETFEWDWNAEFGNRHKPSRCAPMASRISELNPDQTMEAYTARRSMAFMREAKKRKQPFFCWSSFYRPHQPYTPQRAYVEQYDLDAIELPKSLYEAPEKLPPLLERQRRAKGLPWCLGLAAEDVSLYRRYIGYYYALVTEIDAHMGEIMRMLETEGLAENTIVIYSSDHGDFVGHHGMIEKMHSGHNVYEDTLRVPFIVHAPGRIAAQKARTDLVELVDLYPTVLDLAGIEKDSMPGRSLAPTLFEGTPLGRDVAFSENWVMLSAIGARYKLGSWLERPENGFPDMLFDRHEDPLEMNNLIGKPEGAEAMASLREAMREWSERTPNVTGKSLDSLA
jgi:arylsulfatase A-like enzyme